MALAGPEDPTSVATHVQSCLDGFQNACNSMSKAELHIKRKLPPGLINDELGRFSIWSGNVGAHRRGKGSLDYKLREASHIRDRVLELLQNLRSVLQEAIDIITGERVAWEDLSDSDSDTSDDGLQRTEEQPTTELAQLASNMAEINTCLMRLSMAIRNPAPHDQFKKSTHIDVAHFETFDIDHVRGKFPMAKEYLVVRLGKAISRRRQYLRYREEHRKKLEQGLKQLPQQEMVVVPQSMPRTVTAPSEKIESTVASSIPTIAKESASAAAFDENDYYEDALSQTSYASSTNSVVRLRPPRLPDAGLHGDPFECPLCFRFTSVRQTAAWHKHVYRDLQPYVCTNEECEIPDRTYESRHEWFHHESQVHRKYWECVEGCNRHFQSSETLHTHLSHDHSNLTTEDRIDDLIRSCERHDGMATSAECPLCQLQLPSLSLLRRHLGKHHEELSLFALPSHMKEEHEDSEDEEKGDGSRSLPSVAADGRSLSPFLDAGDELGEPNDDNENRLEIVSQPSTSGSSLSSLSSTPAILHCISGDCEAKFDGKHRRVDLARHLSYTHGRSSIYHCEDPDCNRRFYEEDTRLKHYRKHHPTLAHNRSIATAALSIDGYLDKLVAYYRERGIVIDVNRREFVVGERTVTLRDIRKAMEGQGGYHPFTTNYAWAELGRELGQSTRLTSDGVDQAKKIYWEYLLPFDEHLQRGGEEIVRVPANSSEPSAILSEEKEPLKVQISNVSARSSTNRFSLPSPGMIELAEKEIRYFPDDSPEKCRLPVAEIIAIQKMEHNSLEIIGGLYKYDISLWERSEGFTTIVLEFPNIENRDYTSDYIQSVMVQSALNRTVINAKEEPANLANKSLQTAGLDFGEEEFSNLNSLDETNPSSMTHVVVDGLTDGLLRVSASFGTTCFRFTAGPGIFWAVFPDDLQAVEESANSFTLTVDKLFSYVSDTPSEPRRLHVIPLPTDLDRMRRYLKHYMSRVRGTIRPEGEEVSRETSVIPQDSDQNEGPPDHEYGTRPSLPQEYLYKHYDVIGEALSVSSSDLLNFPSLGSISFNGNTLYIYLQYEATRLSWSVLDPTLSDVMLRSDGMIEICGIKRTDTGVAENVKIKAQNSDEERDIIWLFSHFLALQKDQSLAEQQNDTTDVEARDEAQSLPVILIKEQPIFDDARFIIGDKTDEAEIFRVAIVVNQQDLIIMDKNNLGRQWQISRDTIFDIVPVSSSKVSFMAELREGYTVTQPCLAILADPAEFVAMIKVLQRPASNDAAGDNGRPKDQGSADTQGDTAAKEHEKQTDPDQSRKFSMTQAQVDEQRRLLAAEGLHMQREIEAQIESKSDVLDTSHMVTSAESAHRKDNTEPNEQTREQSASPNSSSQESVDTIPRQVQDLEDQYPPMPEIHEFGIKIHILQDGRTISRYSDISLRSTYLRIGIDDLGQVWYIYYKNVTVISEFEDTIDLRSILWRISADAIKGETSKSEFSIKPATSSQMTELLHRLREKVVTFQPHLDKSKTFAPAPSSPEDENEQGDFVGATLFSTLATVNVRGLYSAEVTLSLDREGLVAEDHSAFQHWRFEYKNMSRIAILGRGISFRDTLNALHTDPPGIAVREVLIAPSPPENVERIVALLREHVSDGAISISSDTDQTLQDHRLTLQALRTLRGSREADIIRRCEQADPPIPPESLHRLNGFKEAVASKEPITDMTFELLLPRLRAELELADESISFLISSDEGSSEEEYVVQDTESVMKPTSRDLESSRGPPYLVKASIFRHLRYPYDEQTEQLGTVRLEFFQTFFQLKKGRMRWGMQHQYIENYTRHQTSIDIQGMWQHVSKMENLHGLTEDIDLLVTISTASVQDTEAILSHLKAFEDMKTQAQLEDLRSLRDYVSSQSESESESESKAPIDPESPVRKASTEDPGASTSLPELPQGRFRMNPGFETLYSSETGPIPMVPKLEINETFDQPVDGSASSQRVAEQGTNRQTPNVYGEPSEEVDESTEDDRDEYDYGEIESHERDNDEYERNSVDDQRPLLTAQETASGQQAQPMKLKAEEERVKGAARKAEKERTAAGEDEAAKKERRERRRLAKLAEEEQAKLREVEEERRILHEKLRQRHEAEKEAKRLEVERAEQAEREKEEADTPNAYSKLLSTDSDYEDETTSLARALQRARQSGQKPGETLKRLTAAAAEDKEVNTSVEKDNGPPHKYQCVFWFFDCNYVSSNKSDWTSHSLAHLGDRLPPVVRCPICLTQFTDTPWVSREAWVEYLDHLDEMHGSMIERLSELGGPDLVLLEWLAEVKIISEEERRRIENREWRTGHALAESKEATFSQAKEE